MATVATLTIDLIGNSAKLRTSLAKANKNTKSWAKQTRAAVNGVTKLMVGAGVAGATALGAIYTQAAKSGDALAKLSDQIGEAPERLIALQHAAQITGNSTESFNKSIEQMSKRLGEARQGTGEAGKYIKLLGLDTQAFFDMSPADQFAAISDQVNELGSQTDKAAAASALFGRSGLGLINTMALGSEGLAEMAKEAEDLGITLNRIDLAKVEAANDSFLKTQEVTSAFGKTLATEVAPFVGALSDAFVDSAKEAGGLGTVATSTVNTIIKGVGFASDAVHGLKIVWLGVRQAVAEVANGIIQVASATSRAGVGIAEALGLDDNAFVQAQKNIVAFADSFNETTADLGTEFQQALLEPMPSESVKEWVDDVRAKAEVAAQESAASKSINILSDVGTGSTETGALDTNTGESDVERIRQSLLTEEEALKESLVRREEILKTARDTGQINEEKYQKLLAGIKTKYTKDAETIAAQQKAVTLNNYGQLFDGLAGLAEAGAGKQSGIYKAMFAASKAFSIAEAIVKIQAGIASAAALPFPSNIPAMATVAAQTASIVTTIQGTNMKSFDGGGFTGTGSRSGGVDGKGGFPALLHPNETVLDHTKGQGSSNVYQFSPQITVQGGVDGKAQGEEISDQLEVMFSQFIADQQRPGGQLNRQDAL